MKDRKYIEDNRNLFDDKEPSAGHIERFEALLNSQRKEVAEEKKKPVKRVKLVALFSVAASIAVLVMVAVKFNSTDGISVTPETEITKVDEFQAMNDYYNERMKGQISDIMCKLAYTDEENQAQLTEDIQNIMSENSNFVDEMAKSEDKNLAIRFLEKHYKTNIQVLEDINEKLGKYTNC